MGSSIFNQAAEFLRENKTARRALGIMVCLALLVALGTVGVLTSTGQALTKKVQVLDCVFEGHQHTQDCYDGEGNQVCGYADYAVHVHNDDCYDEANQLVCTLPEVYPHTHTDECWQDVTELVCGQVEDLGHTHTGACYSYTQGEQTCTKEEHVHDETCFSTETVLSCGLSEHAHSEACYNEAGELACGLEEHTHSDACYTQNQVVVCGKEEHTHDASCYEQIGTLICTEAERPAGHVHTEECYKTERVLVCDKLENHEHTEDCFEHDASGARVGNPICGQIELLEHVHGEACLKTVEVLVSDSSGALCGLVEHVHDESCFDPETGAAICGYTEHTHDASCFPAEESSEPVYVCGLEEHTHDEACYDENGELTCGLEEHTHSDACLAPAEAAPQLYCGLEEHTHSEACYDENGELICGLEEHSHSDECFVKPVPVYLCGLPEHTHNEACYDEAGELICGFEEHTHDESCLTKPVVYYCGLEEHSHDEACYDENGELICELPEHTHSDECLEQILIQTAETEDGSIRVTAAYGPEANIPESAEFRVERILPEGETEQHFSERVAEASRIFNEEIADDEKEFMIPQALLNIGFYLADGTEVQPAAPVTITVQFLDESGATMGDSLTVIHFADAGTEALETTALDSQQATTFTTNGFSEMLLISNGSPSGDSSVVGGLEYGVYGPSYSRDTYMFKHNKTIDYLGDNEKGTSTDNPDTTVDNDTAVTDDLYRLYLDMEGKSEPVDLLLVVDFSGSMIPNTAVGRTGSRAATLQQVLFGPDGKSGLVGQFLKPNYVGDKSASEKNYVAMVYYGGIYKTTAADLRWLDPSISPLDSSEGGVSFAWRNIYPTETQGDQNATDNWKIGEKAGWHGANYTTTNYVAGYIQANNMLKSSLFAEARKDHKKVVVFLSDGLPTQYYTKEAFEGAWNSLAAGSQVSITRYGAGTDAMVFNDFDSWGNMGVISTTGDEAERYGLNYHFSNNKDTYNKGADIAYRDKDGNQLTEEQKPAGTAGNYTVIFDSDMRNNPQTGLYSGNIPAGKETDSPYIYESMRCFDVFARNNPNILFFSIGIDMGSKVDDKYSRTVALSYMAGRYQTNLIPVSMGDKQANGEKLEKTLSQIIFPAGVSISDQLSAYVDLYKTQPDIKVTATSKKDGKTVDLWTYTGSPLNTDGAIAGITADVAINGISASNIIKEVNYNSAKKIIKVIFNPSYSLDAGYTFTLSFNVKLTEEAYNTFASYGAEYNGNKGDEGTDYGKNGTSSEKPGLNSNENAAVTYTVDNGTVSEPYDDPVVQAWRSRFAFKKTVDVSGDQGIQGVPFQLLKDGEAYTSFTGATEWAGNPGWYLTDADGTIDFGYLPCGEYTLKERVPNKYVGAGKEDKVWVTFTVDKGRIINVDIKDKDNAAWTEGEDSVWNMSVADFESKVNSSTNTSYYDVGVALTVVNTTIKQNVKLIKVNEDGKPMAGAYFSLYKMADEYNKNQVEVFKNQESNLDGVTGVIYDGELAYGNYQLKEETPPQYYEQLKDAVEFSVTEDGIDITKGTEVATVLPDKDGDGNIVVQITNTRNAVEAHLYKRDSSTHKALAGAQFALYGPFELEQAYPEGGFTVEPIWTGTSQSTEGEGLGGEILGEGEKADFPALQEGKAYFLVETVTPAGYNTHEPIKLSVAAGKVTTNHSTVEIKETAPNSKSYTIAIDNATGFVLPRSGGEGTTVYLLSGAALIALAGSLLLLKKKKASRA